MHRGLIKRLVSDRGFGFIKHDGHPDAFFHLSKVVGGSDTFEEMYEDQDVEFELEEGCDKPRAKLVRPI